MGDWIDSDELVWKSLIITAEERQRLIALEEQLLSVIRPVALPRGKHLVGENTHLGWPVGIQIGDTLLCAYHRTKHHHGPGTFADRRDEHSSDAVVVRSTDGGETWSTPTDIRHAGTAEGELVVDVQNCFGRVDDTIFLATRYGLYRSSDRGQTWQLIPDALTQAQTDHNSQAECGPRMILHPERGLVIPTGPKDEPFLDVFNSTDAGETNRSGGGPENERDEQHEKTLNLWSTSKDDLRAGRAKHWRFEGTLLRWPHGTMNFRPDGIDAAHPGGAVMDTNRGVQHIFIHSGPYATPTGVYRISRTLETHRLREEC